MRISFYWAPDEDAFNSGEGVIQLGKTTMYLKQDLGIRLNFIQDIQFIGI
jgi:hypothetical protein